MRVRKHGCGVKMFCFLCVNHPNRVQNLISLLYLPIPSSAETWKIVTHKCVNFFLLKVTF